MKRSAILAAALMMFVPVMSIADNLIDFEGGQKEFVASLSAPGYEATVNIDVPAGYYVTNATMKVTGMAAAGNASAYPEGVTLKLNDSVIWAFQQNGFGALGRQNQFSTGQKMVNSSFGSGGGVNTQYIRLPKNATVQSATMEVGGIPPTTGQELVNFTGSGAGDEMGFWSGVSNAGDVNGDGYDDVIVGAQYNDAGGADAGQAYIFYGGMDMDNIADVTFTGIASGDNLGFSVSGAGDVNNDGYDDVIVGAYPASSGDYACIYYGGQNMDNNPDVTCYGENLGDMFAYSVSSAGDVNGDGFGDVIVGASRYDTYTGRAYIYFGGANMDNSSDVVLTGDPYRGAFGHSVSDAGDVNNDGYDDVIVGEPNYGVTGTDVGKASLFFGGQNMDNVVDKVFFEDGILCLGKCVSTAGDVNNDTYDDILIGSDHDLSTYGQWLYIYYGGQNMDTKSDVIFSNNLNISMYSQSANAGDMNNDGYDDVIIGNYSNGAGGEYTGQARIFFGNEKMDNVSDIDFIGAAPWDWFGVSVSGAGDVNGDGYDEVIVGAWGNDAGGNNSGSAYVYTCHVSNLTGIVDPGVSIGSKNIWKETGQYNGSAVLGDFSNEINAYLATVKMSGKDSYGNAYVDVPVVANASDGGKLSFRNLSITYSYDATVPDFTTVLGNYLTAHRNDEDGNGNIEVPIKVRAQSAGRIKLSGLELNISPDLPPALVKGIGNVELLEDGWNTSLVDLYQNFQDDLDPDTMLNFSIASATNSTYVRLWISGKRYLSADAMTGDANNNWTGTVEVVVACADHWGHTTKSNQFTICVRNVNDAPAITSKPATTAEAGTLYYYNVTAIDGDNDILKYSLTKEPVGMTIDDKTGKIQWMPRERGDFPISIVVSDGNATALQNFSISVPNKAPRITSTPLLNATTGVKYVYDMEAVDDNGDNLTFSLSSQIEGMTIDSRNGTIMWTPLYPGSVDVAVSVTDGRERVEQRFTIKVVQANRAPRFLSKPVTTAKVGVAYSYGAKATDEDGDVLGYVLEAGPEGMTVDGVSGKVNWMPATAGNFTVKVKVADGNGGVALQEFTINVADRASAKVEVLRPSENEKVKGKVVLSGTALKGTLEIIRVELKIDDGEWMNATGMSSWELSLDTTKLKNGAHVLSARVFDGTDYSDIATRTFSVDNKAPGAAKGFIPGLEGLMVIVVIGLACAIGHIRRGRKPEIAR